MQVGLWIVAGTAGATDYDVGSGQPYATVGAAVAQATLDAGADHTIRILDTGPYTETVVITEAMSVRGEGVVPLLHPLDPVAGVFQIAAPGAVVTIAGIEIDGQLAGRALLVQQGIVVVSSASIHDTVSGTSPGGAILVSGAAGDRLTITDSTFTGSATIGAFDGGAVAMLGGDLEVLRTAFVGGSAGDDGGHIAIVTGSGSDLTVEDCTFTNGVAAESGGALYLRDGNVEILRSRFETNHASAGGGGAIQAEATLSLLVEDSTFVANDATAAGGAIHQVDGTASFVRGTFCDNDAGGTGGAIFLGATLTTIDNGVFLRNLAGVDGGAVATQTSLVTFRHNSLSGNSAGGSGHALAAGAAPGVTLSDSYFGDHPAGSEAVVSIVAASATVVSDGWWANAAGDWGPAIIDLGGHVVADSLIPAPAVGACDPLLVRPPAGSPLLGAASDGTDIGAFGGASTWPDADGDGWISLEDCDDTAATTWPGAPELTGDGADQDCDGGEICWLDTDGDGFGDPLSLVASADVSCSGTGEAWNPDESCEGFDDALDVDLDGRPDGCDICAGFPDYPDTDGDGVVDGCDDCPLDSADDTDEDGICDSSDPCPDDPGRCDTGDTAAAPIGGETGAPTKDGAAEGHTADTGSPAIVGPVTGAGETTDRGAATEGGGPGLAGCGCGTGRAPGSWPLVGLLVGLSAGSRRRRPRWVSTTPR